MKNFTIYSVQLCLILCFFASCLADSSPKQPKRSRGSYAIMPVMRVGRRSSIFPHKKGESQPLLTPFMRTGRGDSTENVLVEEDNGAKKRTGSGNSGLWFGPRLGRVQKRTEYNPWNYIIVDDPQKSDDYFQVDVDDFNA